MFQRSQWQLQRIAAKIQFQMTHVHSQNTSPVFLQQNQSLVEEQGVRGRVGPQLDTGTGIGQPTETTIPEFDVGLDLLFYEPPSTHPNYLKFLTLHTL